MTRLALSCVLLVLGCHSAQPEGAPPRRPPLSRVYYDAVEMIRRDNACQLPPALVALQVVISTANKSDPAEEQLAESARQWTRWAIKNVQYRLAFVAARAGDRPCARALIAAATSASLEFEGPATSTDLDFRGPDPKVLTRPMLEEMLDQVAVDPTCDSHLTFRSGTRRVLVRYDEPAATDDELLLAYFLRAAEHF